MKAVDRVVPWTKWAFTDAVAAMNCPKCKQLAGEDCRTPKGRKAWPPHNERVGALMDTGYTENRVAVSNARDVLMGIRKNLAQ